uniref:Cytochrome P450 3200C1 n=1 Tax=Chamberlinius hualienensis TaxID=1551368 RepID=A0A1J1E7N8_9MYRI|nr:cytochrome P450 3200C1 [Chamberlinius hualienensis]
MEVSTNPWIWILMILLLFVAYWYLGGPRNLPPGSAGIPILGYLPFLDQFSYKTFKILGQKYGNVFHLYLGSRLVIVLNDYFSIHEAFIKNSDTFSGRPSDNVFKESTTNNLGLTANDGEYWKQHRRFILNYFKNNGYGKLNLEPIILDEIDHFIKELKNHVGKSFNIKPLLMHTAGNNICILATGKRFDYNSPEFRLLISTIFSPKLVPFASLNSFFPWLVQLPWSDKILKREKTKKYFDRVNNAVAGVIRSVKHEYVSGQEGNYIHAFMTENHKRKQVNEADDFFSDLSLLHMSRSLILAGIETTSSTLLYCLLYMTLYPEVQKNVQNEIDRVIGHERQPSYDDRMQMIYTEATILEIFRKSCVVPLSIPHRCRKTITIGGHVIPQDVMVIPNIWAIHHDPRLWGDPHTFRPERFIDRGRRIILSEYILPFSLGKRACVGEPLARMEIFLCFVSLLQHFTFVPPIGEELHLESYPGLTIRPKCENICAVLREYPF